MMQNKCNIRRGIHVSKTFFIFYFPLTKNVCNLCLLDYDLLFSRHLWNKTYSTELYLLAAWKLLYSLTTHRGKLI